MMPVAQAFLASLPRGFEDFESAFLLAVGWSATIGGVATPVGTPTNGIFLALFQEIFPAEGEFPFATFMGAAFPVSFALLTIVWLMVCVRHVWGKNIPVNRGVFQQMLADLGPMS